MKKLLKGIDDAVFNDALRRARVFAKRFPSEQKGSSLVRAVEINKRERSITPDLFVRHTSPPRFIGGTTGRSGTKWMVQLLTHLLGKNPVVIGELGMFTLGLFRSAPYEYYQYGGIGARQKRDRYIDHFLKQVVEYAYRRRRVYGGGMKGLIRIIPVRAIKLAGEALREDLAKLEDLESVYNRFGEFYLHLLNYHATVVSGHDAGWINKEPPYGRHVDDLYRMVPDARLVILARDGRASALSMHKRGVGSVRECMIRWKEFSEMTIAGLDAKNAGRALLLKYEDVVSNFEDSLSRVFSYYELGSPPFDLLQSERGQKLVPRTDSLSRWEKELTKDDLQWFEANCSETMDALGYES